MNKYRETHEGVTVSLLVYPQDTREGEACSDTDTEGGLYVQLSCDSSIVTAPPIFTRPENP